jgi:hypothetical protein
MRLYLTCVCGKHDFSRNAWDMATIARPKRVDAVIIILQHSWVDLAYYKACLV